MIRESENGRNAIFSSPVWEPKPPAEAFPFAGGSGSALLELPVRLLCLSLDHRRAPVALRERIGLRRHEVPALLEALSAGAGVRETLALSTCNRIELYAVADAGSETDLAGVLAEFKQVDTTALTDAARLLENRGVVRHLFGLVCGLESLALGETEIVGQIKKAYADAFACNATGKILNSLFQRAFAVAKHIRTGTDIGRFRVSVAGVAVDEVLRRRPDLQGERVAVWGTGPVGRAAVSSFAKAGITGGTVLSRDLHRARNLSTEWNGSARLRDAMREVIARSDVFVCCTGAPHPVIHAATVGARAERPLLLVDLAVPRDVDADVSELPGVAVLDMDTLGAVRQQGLDARQRARETVLPVLETQADQFFRCLNAAMSERCLADWQAAAHEALSVEQRRLFDENPAMAATYRAELEAMSHRLLHRLLTWPMKAMACAIRDGLPCADIYPEVSLDPEEMTMPSKAEDARNKDAS